MISQIQLEIKEVLVQLVNENSLDKSQIERFSRQLVLKNIRCKRSKKFYPQKF